MHGSPMQQQPMMPPPMQGQSMPRQQQGSMMPMQQRPARAGGFGRVFFVLLVLCAAGAYIYNTLAPTGMKRAVLESGSLGASYQGEALIVRNEIVISEEGVPNVTYLAL